MIALQFVEVDGSAARVREKLKWTSESGTSLETMIFVTDVCATPPTKSKCIVLKRWQSSYCFPTSIHAFIHLKTKHITGLQKMGFLSGASICRACKQCNRHQKNRALWGEKYPEIHCKVLLILLVIHLNLIILSCQSFRGNYPCEITYDTMRFCFFHIGWFKFWLNMAPV